MSRFGIVIIGRNEGERLWRCIESLINAGAPIVYVDSGSGDNSVALARSLSVDVLELQKPFSAARARNAGLTRLLELAPGVEYVQFVDGDCEIQPTWFSAANEQLDRRPDIGAICGRLRERHPEASIFNRLCDLEWNSGIGEIRACGGICMIRVKPFLAVGQFNTALVAGEEGELCHRLRQASFKIVRLDTPMALHDAAMTSFGQWWKRSTRAGHAYAQNASLHAKREGHPVRQLLSAAVYGFALPVFAIAAAIVAIWFRPAWAIVAAIVLLEIVLVIRVSSRRMKMGDPASAAFQYGLFMVPAKAAHCVGALKFWCRILFGRQIELIEHKPA